LDEALPFDCPLCGARSTVTVDICEGRNHRLVQDCPVCCSPLIVSIQIRKGRPEITRVVAEGE
jgi:transcription elongation factor Elf1